MQIYHIPRPTETIIFDIDMTLYRHEGYGLAQIQDQKVLLAQELQIPFERMERELGACEAQMMKDALGRRPSFGNLLLKAYGISIERSVALRERALQPEKYLKKDASLREALVRLRSQGLKWCALTNNPTSVARRTLKALGVEDLFETVVGLDVTGHSKPSPQCYEELMRKFPCGVSTTLSVGDRFAVDLEMPLLLGMGGVLVESMEDVYQLPSLLQETAKDSAV